MWLPQIRQFFDYSLSPENHYLKSDWDRNLYDELPQTFKIFCDDIAYFRWNHLLNDLDNINITVRDFKKWRQEVEWNFGPEKLTQRVLTIDLDAELYEIAPKRYLNAPLWLDGKQKNICFDAISRIHKAVTQYIEEAYFKYWEEHYDHIQNLVEILDFFYDLSAPAGYRPQSPSESSRTFSWDPEYWPDPFHLPPPSFQS